MYLSMFVSKSKDKDARGHGIKRLSIWGREGLEVGDGDRWGKCCNYI